MDPSPQPSSVWWWLIGACALAAAALVAVILVIAPWSDTGSASRQSQVEARGRSVMPFDQDQTTHRFTPTAWGGTETVRVLPGATRDQVGLVRMHLGHEQMLFASGDFSDPMAIHGHTMPGAQALAGSAATGALAVSYVTVPGGAELEYRAADPAVVSSVHTWFAAQLRDHGAHATAG